MSGSKTILFAGGGTGGHIFPNLAVLERLRAAEVGIEPVFVVSDRPIDAEVCGGAGVEHVVVGAAPLSIRPRGAVRFVVGYRRTRRQIAALIEQRGVRAAIGTGGFVAAPAIDAAARAGLPVGLVNLDAVPGRANRLMAKKASAVFSAYDTAGLPGATYAGVPLRRAVLVDHTPGDAREALGLDPDRPTLAVVAGSQGAVSVNQAMAAVVADDAGRPMLDGWQVIHLAGLRGRDELARAYQAAGVPAIVDTFTSRMGRVWSAADLAVSRAGAGSVAELWANAVPTVFLPYPHHRDQHQRHNAAPLEAAGGAVILTDHIDPAANAAALRPALADLLSSPDRRQAMRAALRASAPPDGSAVVAAWLTEALG